jgi:FtsH-binding integral membrane protein
MANYDRNSAQYGSTVARGAEGAVDEGLRAYMLRVYNYMAIGLALTGVFAYVAFSLSMSATPTEYALGNGEYLTSFGYALFVSPLKWVVIFAPLALVFFLSFRIQHLSVGAAQTTFWIYAAAVGLSLATIFLVYTAQSITQVFFITAATFGAMSLWGYTTKRDLTGMGSFLFMGLIGLIVASIVGFFWQSTALQFAISVVGVLVFTGLTAYDTQKIKEMYYVGDDGTVAGKKAIMGALSLYLDFINLFLMLLRLFGDRR